MNMGKKFVLFLASVCMMGFAACDGDGDADYGFGKIYMPQAMQSGGLNNSYAVPSGDGEYTYNFRVTAGYVKAVLGVTRSGKLSDARGFSVSVYTSEEETAAAVSQFGGEPMPSDFYEPLPGRSRFRPASRVKSSTWRFLGAGFPIRPMPAKSMCWQWAFPIPRPMNSPKPVR